MPCPFSHHLLVMGIPDGEMIPVEDGSNWVRPVLADMEHAWTHSPTLSYRGPGVLLPIGAEPVETCVP